MNTHIKLFITFLLFNYLSNICCAQTTFQRYTVGQASILIPDYLYKDTANEYTQKIENMDFFLPKNKNAYTMINTYEIPKTDSDKSSGNEIHNRYIEGISKNSYGLRCKPQKTKSKQIDSVIFYFTKVDCTETRKNYNDAYYHYTAIAETKRSFYLIDCITPMELKKMFADDFEKVVFSLVER